MALRQQLIPTRNSTVLCKVSASCSPIIPFCQRESSCSKLIIPACLFTTPTLATVLSCVTLSRTVRQFSNSSPSISFHLSLLITKYFWIPMIIWYRLAPGKGQCHISWWPWEWTYTKHDLNLPFQVHQNSTNQQSISQDHTDN